MQPVGYIVLYITSSRLLSFLIFLSLVISLESSNNNLQHTKNNLSSSMGQQKQNGESNNQVQSNSNPNASTVSTTISRPNSTIGYVVIPYTKGLAESFKNTCGKYGIQTYFKGNITIK